MNNEPLVSTVIICFNTEQFISEAIESVIAQTYSNWELLLVDDGSTDNSSMIMQNYASKYPEKIRYLEHLEHQNRGKNASRNLGINSAKGDYIALLDSDDIWLPQKLTQQVELFKQYPEAGMIYGRVYLWYDWGEQLSEQQRNRATTVPLGVEPNTVIHPPQLLLSLLEGLAQTPTTCSPLICRETFEKVGLFDENFQDIYEDQIFFAKVLYHLPVLASDQFWAKYRQHSDSTMGKFEQSMQKRALVWLKKRLKFLKSVKKYSLEQEISYLEVEKFFDVHLTQLRRTIWLHNTPLISNIYFLWQKLLVLIILAGHYILPPATRSWLWKKIGDRLYRF